MFSRLTWWSGSSGFVEYLVGSERNSQARNKRGYVDEFIVFRI